MQEGKCEKKRRTPASLVREVKVRELDFHIRWYCFLLRRFGVMHHVHLSLHQRRKNHSCHCRELRPLHQVISMIGYNDCSCCLFTLGGELRKVLTSRKVTDELKQREW